jgi:hypothetical protein
LDFINSRSICLIEFFIYAVAVALLFFFANDLFRSMLFRHFLGSHLWRHSRVLVMWLNYHLSDTESTIFNETIIKTGHLARGRYGSCEQPYILVNYRALEKQLVFYCGNEVEVIRVWT